MELLTVVAIIAILMALLFPTFKTAKENSRKTSCISKLHTIAAALQQYQLDNHRYPSCLLGYYQAGQPMTSCTSGLYPEYVRSIKDFTCDSANVNVDDKITVDVTPSADKDGQGKKLDYYVGDSYDWTNMTMTGSPVATYMNTWAYSAASVKQCKPDNPADDDEKRDFGRQLRFKNVDSTTVVTWCMNHRSSGNVAEVLFADGTVLPIALEKMDPTAGNVLWRAMPN